MPDISNTGLAQCEDCGHHFQISPRGEIQLGACPDCGGKRLFRMQPNPVQSEGTLRNMVDMETGKDTGGNPDGEGILAPPSGRSILTTFIDDPRVICPTRGCGSHDTVRVDRISNGLPYSYGKCLSCGMNFRWPSEGELAPVSAEHPDPWMDNEPGSTTFPEHWTGHLITTFVGDDRECPNCHLLTSEMHCPNCGAFIDDIASNPSGIPAELRPQIGGAPLTEGSIFKDGDDTVPYDTGNRGRDEYTHGHVLSSLITADYEGYPNWDTWNTKLILDNDEHLHKMQNQMAREGWSPDQIRDWTIENVIGPYNKEAIEDAQKWNVIPEHERVDPHFEQFINKNPSAQEAIEGLGFGPDVSDVDPLVIDHEMVDWPGIHNDINKNYQENLAYERGEDPIERDRKLKMEQQKNLDIPGKDTFPSEWVSKIAALEPCPNCGGSIVAGAMPVEGGNWEQIYKCRNCGRKWYEQEYLKHMHQRDDIPGSTTFPQEWISKIADAWTGHDPLENLRCPNCHNHGLMIDKGFREIFCPYCDWGRPINTDIPGSQQMQLENTAEDVYKTPPISINNIPKRQGKIAGEMEDFVFGETPTPKSNLNWTPGMHGRGIVIGGEPHTWNAYDPADVEKINQEFAPNGFRNFDWGPMHARYVESLGVDPKHVDWNTGIEIDPDGKVIATGGHDVAPFIAADPRLKHVEDKFFSFSSVMPTISRTNNMEPYASLWTHEADVMFDQGPLQNTPNLTENELIRNQGDKEFTEPQNWPPAEPRHSIVVQPSEAGIHGAHTGRRGVLSFLDAYINGIPVRGNGGNLIEKYGFRKSPQFGKPVIVAVHDPAHLPIAVESIQHPNGASASINNLIPRIKSGEIAAPPGINPQTLEPLPGAMKRTASFWSTLGEAALPVAGLALAPETGGASLALDAGEAGALLGGEAAGAAGAGAAEGAAAEGASGTAGGLMSKAMSGAGGLAKAEGVSSLVNQGVGMAGNALGMGQGQQGAGGGAGYSGPLQQFTHVLAAFVQSDIHDMKPAEGIRCPNCRGNVYVEPTGKDIYCPQCLHRWPVHREMSELQELHPQDAMQGLYETPDIPTGLWTQQIPKRQGKIADYETPASNPDVGVKHDDPEDIDQKEFNDQDKNPENLLNPNIQDSGASGEDEVRKDMDKDTQAHFSPDSPGIQRMEMLMPLIEKYYHSEESGANDPMLQGLHEMLESESPGYLERANAEAAERFMHNKRHPDHVHANIKESITPPMQQGNLQAQQQALDPTGANPSQQPSSITPPGGGAQQGHCKNCGAVLQASGYCPQCGQQNAQEGEGMGILPGGPSVSPNPQTFAHTDLLASFVDSANHQGPVTPEQIAAVQQYLIQEGRVDEVPNVPLDPGNPEYAKILSDIQNRPNVPPSVTPEEQTQPPAPQQAPPGGMPVPGMAPGETGGQPMQPMSSFLPEINFEKEADILFPPCPHPLGPHTGADNVAPRCPKCGSGTTGLVGDQDHNARCHACHNVWKLKDVVSDENYGQTSIAKTAEHEDHQQYNNQANPVGVPAAEQEDPVNQGGDEDSSLTWKDSSGAPLKAGQQYQMVNPSYQLPDLVRVERVKPDGIDVTLLGTYANDPSQHDPNTLTTSVPISKQDMEMQHLSFEPVNETVDDRNNEPPTGSQAPGFGQVPPSGQTTDERANSEPEMLAQSHVENDPDCPRCGHREFTSSMINPESTEHNCFRCGHDWVTEEKPMEYQAGVDLSWLNEDDDAEDLSPRQMGMSRAQVQSRNISDIAKKDQRLRAAHDHLNQNKNERTHREAGRHFTPKEQRELIEEDGVARNSDMLNLEGTHYKSSKEQERVNADNAPDSHMFMGLF